MQKEDILNAIGSPVEGDGKLSLYDVTKLGSACKSFALRFNDETYEYFYEVEVDDMVREDFPLDCITGKGWKLSDDGKKAFRYI